MFKKIRKTYCRYPAVGSLLAALVGVAGLPLQSGCAPAPELEHIAGHGGDHCTPWIELKPQEADYEQDISGDGSVLITQEDFDDLIARANARARQVVEGEEYNNRELGTIVLSVCDDGDFQSLYLQVSLDDTPEGQEPDDPLTPEDDSLYVGELDIALEVGAIAYQAGDPAYSGRFLLDLEGGPTVSIAAHDPDLAGAALAPVTAILHSYEECLQTRGEEECQNPSETLPPEIVGTFDIPWNQFYDQVFEIDGEEVSWRDWSSLQQPMSSIGELAVQSPSTATNMILQTYFAHLLLTHMNSQQQQDAANGGGDTTSPPQGSADPACSMFANDAEAGEADMRATRATMLIGAIAIVGIIVIATFSFGLPLIPMIFGGMAAEVLLLASVATLPAALAAYQDVAMFNRLLENGTCTYGTLDKIRIFVDLAPPE